MVCWTTQRDLFNCKYVRVDTITKWSKWFCISCYARNKLSTLFLSMLIKSRPLISHLLICRTQKKKILTIAGETCWLHRPFIWSIRTDAISEEWKDLFKYGNIRIQEKEKFGGIVFKSSDSNFLLSRILHW